MCLKLYFRWSASLLPYTYLSAYFACLVCYAMSFITWNRQRITLDWGNWDRRALYSAGHLSTINVSLRFQASPMHALKCDSAISIVSACWFAKAAIKTGMEANVLLVAISVSTGIPQLLILNVVSIDSTSGNRLNVSPIDAVDQQITR